MHSKFLLVADENPLSRVHVRVLLPLLRCDPGDQRNNKWCSSGAGARSCSRGKFCDPIMSWTVYKWPMPGQDLMQFRWQNNKYLLHPSYGLHMYQHQCQQQQWQKDCCWWFTQQKLSVLCNAILSCSKYTRFVLQNPFGSVDIASLRGFNLVLETNFGSAVRLTDIRTLNSSPVFIKNNVEISQQNIKEGLNTWNLLSLWLLS